MDPSNQNKHTMHGIPEQGLTLFVGGEFFNENKHLKGCVCPECPTYDKEKNERISRWIKEDDESA